MTDPKQFTTSRVKIAQLTPHPRNYNSHPEDQRAHIMQSIREHGIYRNIVVANDNTILAGHGVVEAATALGIDTVPVKRMPYGPNDPKALKLLAADNELSNLSMKDDRVLTEMLKEIGEIDIDGLLGTGFDERQLANLIYVTRPAQEIEDENHAGAWAGLPGFEGWTPEPKLILRFDTEDERDAFIEKVDIKTTSRGKHVWSAWWPSREQDDPRNAKFVTGEADA